MSVYSCCIHNSASCRASMSTECPWTCHEYSFYASTKKRPERQLHTLPHSWIKQTLTTQLNLTKELAFFPKDVQKCVCVCVCFPPCLCFFSPWVKQMHHFSVLKKNKKTLYSRFSLPLCHFRVWKCSLPLIFSQPEPYPTRAASFLVSSPCAFLLLTVFYSCGML